MDKYYNILGIDKNATLEDVKKARNKLIKLYHPDINKGANGEQKMKEINEAYNKVVEYIKTGKVSSNIEYDDRGNNNTKNYNGYNYSYDYYDNVNQSNKTNYTYIDDEKEIRIKNIDLILSCCGYKDVYIGDIYIYHELGPWLVKENAVLLKVGFDEYVDLSKVRNVKQIKEKLFKAKHSEKAKLNGEFFVPYEWDKMVLNFKHYTNVKINNTSIIKSIFKKRKK